MLLLYHAPAVFNLLQLLPPEAYPDVPTSSLTTRFVASTQNKTRCPVFCTRFAPDSRRVLTGDSAGGISVWSTQDFGYMQYLQVSCCCRCYSTHVAVSTNRPSAQPSPRHSPASTPLALHALHNHAPNLPAMHPASPMADRFW
jgi:WD40 repeat protein